MLVAHKETAYIHQTQDPEFNRQDSKTEIKHHHGRYNLERLKLEKAYPIALMKRKVNYYKILRKEN